jgi:hypothetical protein
MRCSSRSVAGARRRSSSGPSSSSSTQRAAKPIPRFEHLTRRWGFFYVDTLGRWLEEVERGLTAGALAAEHPDLR